jgi:hypothetical protein
LLEPIYRTLEWMRLLATFQFYFLVSRVEVSHVLVFLVTIKRGREGGDLRGSIVLLLFLNRKTDVCYSYVMFPF